MDLKVNLVSKGRKTSKNKGLITNVMIGSFGFIASLFLLSVGYVTFRMYSLNRQIGAVSLESVGVSSEIRANNDAVNRYVLAKEILDYTFQIDSAKFHYKKYLDEIVSILPSNVVLRGVDFQVKGWVSVTAFIPDLASLRNFEERIMDKTILDQTVFTSVFSEGFLKEKTTNGYVIKLQFELKKNV